MPLTLKSIMMTRRASLKLSTEPAAAGDDTAASLVLDPPDTPASRMGASQSPYSSLQYAAVAVADSFRQPRHGGRSSLSHVSDSEPPVPAAAGYYNGEGDMLDSFHRPRRGVSQPGASLTDIPIENMQSVVDRVAAVAEKYSQDFGGIRSRQTGLMRARYVLQLTQTLEELQTPLDLLALLAALHRSSSKELLGRLFSALFVPDLLTSESRTAVGGSTEHFFTPSEDLFGKSIFTASSFKEYLRGLPVWVDTKRLVSIPGLAQTQLKKAIFDPERFMNIFFADRAVFEQLMRDAALYEVWNDSLSLGEDNRIFQAVNLQIKRKEAEEDRETMQRIQQLHEKSLDQMKGVASGSSFVRDAFCGDVLPHLNQAKNNIDEDLRRFEALTLNSDLLSQQVQHDAAPAAASASASASAAPAAAPAPASASTSEVEQAIQTQFEQKRSLFDSDRLRHSAGLKTGRYVPRGGDSQQLTAQSSLFFAPPSRANSGRSTALLDATDAQPSVSFFSRVANWFSSSALVDSSNATPSQGQETPGGPGNRSSSST